MTDPTDRVLTKIPLTKVSFLTGETNALSSIHIEAYTKTNTQPKILSKRIVRLKPIIAPCFFLIVLGDSPNQSVSGGLLSKVGEVSWY